MLVTREVLDRFELGVVSNIQSLGNAGGFSGAQLWRVRCDRGDYCLRRWPHPTRLSYIEGVHHSLLIANSSGLCVAAPILDRSGNSVVTLEGSLWELAKWMPGAADFNQNPSLKRLNQLMKFLAQFHQLDFGGFGGSMPNKRGKSPSLLHRKEMLARAPQRIREIGSMIEKKSSHPLHSLAKDCLEVVRKCLSQTDPFGESNFDSEFELTTIIGDTHHDHFLFEGDNLSGVVDFGAMKHDTVSIDLTRLIGRLRLVGAVTIEGALDCYGQHNPLVEIDSKCVEFLHRCNLLGGILNWLDWIFVQEKSFEDLQAVRNRLIPLVQSLQH